MRIYHDLADLPVEHDLHLAVGIFDGVHLGHQAVIESAIQMASVSHGLSGVLTFTPHPSRILRPQEPTLLLQPPAEKEVVLERLGVDLIVWLPFTRELATNDAENFVPSLAKMAPGLASLHVGGNFRFGRGRKGDVELMVQTARPLGINVLSIDRLHFNGEPISSTRIRQVLASGQIHEVNQLLGYHYLSRGVVQPGRQLGRQLGFPTLNLPWEPECRPPMGVYVVQARRVGQEESWRPAVANYGLRPTFEQTTKPLLEVHLLNGAPYAQGDFLEIEWLRFLRPERRFSGPEELKAQIARDKEEAVNWFSTSQL